MKYILTGIIVVMLVGAIALPTGARGFASAAHEGAAAGAVK